MIDEGLARKWLDTALYGGQFRRGNIYSLDSKIGPLVHDEKKAAKSVGMLTVRNKENYDWQKRQ